MRWGLVLFGALFTIWFWQRKRLSKKWLAMDSRKSERIHQEGDPGQGDVENIGSPKRPKAKSNSLVFEENDDGFVNIMDSDYVYKRRNFQQLNSVQDVKEKFKNSKTPTDKLKPYVKNGKQPVVIFSPGSFSPPTVLHFRLLEDGKDLIGHEDGNVNQLYPGSLFNKIFELLDADNSGKVSRGEVCAYFTKIVGDERTEGPEAQVVQLGGAA